MTSVKHEPLCYSSACDSCECDLIRKVKKEILDEARELIAGHRFDYVELDTGQSKCRHPDHLSGWSTSCPKAWAADRLAPLLGKSTHDN